MNPAVLQTSVNAKMYWVFTRSARFNDLDNAVTFFCLHTKSSITGSRSNGFLT